MKVKVVRGAGFRGALDYVFDTRSVTGTKQPLLLAGNMAGQRPRELAAEFSATRRLRPDIGRPVWHASLSLPRGEKLSPDRWSKIADDFVRRMRFVQSTPWVAVRHHDTDHEHIHIIASRISLDGQLWTGEYEARRAIEISQQLEQDHNLKLTPGLWDARAQKKKLSGNEIQRAIRTGELPPRLHLQRLIEAAAKGMPTALQFAERLAVAGVTVRAAMANTGKLNGFSFELSGVSFKGSDLGKSFSWAGLQRLGVQYEQGRDREQLAAKFGGRLVVDTGGPRDGIDSIGANGHTASSQAAPPQPGSHAAGASRPDLGSSQVDPAARPGRSQSATGRSVSALPGAAAHGAGLSVGTAGAERDGQGFVDRAPADRDCKPEACSVVVPDVAGDTSCGARPLGVGAAPRLPGGGAERDSGDRGRDPAPSRATAFEGAAGGGMGAARVVSGHAVGAGTAAINSAAAGSAGKQVARQTPRAAQRTAANPHTSATLKCDPPEMPADSEKEATRVYTEPGSSRPPPRRRTADGMHNLRRSHLDSRRRRAPLLLQAHAPHLLGELLTLTYPGLRRHAPGRFGVGGPPMTQTQHPTSGNLGPNVLSPSNVDLAAGTAASLSTVPPSHNKDQDPDRRRVEFRRSLTEQLQEMPSAGLESLLSMLVYQETPEERSLLARLAQQVSRLLHRFISLFRQIVGEVRTDLRGLPTGTTRRLLAEVVLDELNERAQSSPRGQSQIEPIQRQLEQRRTDSRHFLAQCGPTDPDSLRSLADAEAQQTSGLIEARAEVEQAKAEVRTLRAQSRPRGILSVLSGSRQELDEQLRQAEFRLESATDTVSFIQLTLGREQKSALQRITERVDRLTLAIELYSFRIVLLDREIKARKRLDELEAERQRRWQRWKNGRSDLERREHRDRYPRER